MNNKNEINSIKIIPEKITNPTMAYDLDEDININNSPKFEEKKINSNKKIELKQLIISDYNDISINFYNFYEENNSISDNIKKFLISNFIKEI